MATRSALSVRFGWRACVALVAALAGVTVIASPASAAKKPPPSPDSLVSQLLAEIEDQAGRVDIAADKISVDVTKRLDRAVERLSLREVLKVDQTTAKAVERASKAFERFATKGQTRVLKELDKLTSNPEHALAVRTAVAEAVAHVQTVHNGLRTEVADMVNEAIDTIQQTLDAELTEDVGGEK